MSIVVTNIERSEQMVTVLKLGVRGSETKSPCSKSMFFVAIVLLTSKQESGR